MMVAREAEEAWCPPTFTPSTFSRTWLAWWMVQLASHSTFFSSSRRIASSRALGFAAAPSAIGPSLSRFARKGEMSGALLQDWKAQAALSVAKAASFHAALRRQEHLTAGVRQIGHLERRLGLRRDR